MNGTPGANRLHLREALKNSAEGCGKTADVLAIFTALQYRFGLSPRKAGSKLNVLKKGFMVPLHEHAAKKEILVQAAYENLPKVQQTEVVLDTHCNTLRHLILQKHLLAIRVPTHLRGCCLLKRVCTSKNYWLPTTYLK